MRRRVMGLPLAITALAALTFLGPATAGAKAPVEGPISAGPPAMPALTSIAEGPSPFERVQRQIVRDRDRALRGARLSLGGISDGNFDVRILEQQGKVVILMPPLRARHLERTRELVARRYSNENVVVRLARRVKPQRMRPPAVAPRPGKPLLCPVRAGRSPAGDWNAKQIVGMPVARAERVARRHGCSVRVVVIDGMGLAVHLDLSRNRVNVVVRAGKVVRILGIV